MINLGFYLARMWSARRISSSFPALISLIIAHVKRWSGRIPCNWPRLSWTCWTSSPRIRPFSIFWLFWTTFFRFVADTRNIFLFSPKDHGYRIIWFCFRKTNREWICSSNMRLHEMSPCGFISWTCWIVPWASSWTWPRELLPRWLVGLESLWLDRICNST